MGFFSNFGLSGTGDASISDYQAVRSGNVMDGGERDDAWQIAIVNEIAAIPSNPAEIFTPEEVGRIDAEEHKDCEPTEHYIKLGDIEAYVIGYKQAKGELEMTADYEEDILDREFWAWGQY